MENIEVKIDEEMMEELCKKPEFKYWTVFENGDMEEKYDPKEQSESSYPISANRLNKTNWLSHVFKKVGPDWSDEKKIEFYFAYVEAIKNAGFTSISIDLENEE